MNRVAKYVIGGVVGAAVGAGAVAITELVEEVKASREVIDCLSDECYDCCCDEVTEAKAN